MAFEQRSERHPLCGDRGEACFRQWEQHVQRCGGRNQLGRVKANMASLVVSKEGKQVGTFRAIAEHLEFILVVVESRGSTFGGGYRHGMEVYKAHLGCCGVEGWTREAGGKVGRLETMGA